MNAHRTDDDSRGLPDGQHERQHPAHGVFLVDGQPTIVFGTVCTKDRVPWLANDKVHSTLCDVWRAADAWLLGRYVIMPDHIHFFAGWTGREIELDHWITYWKSQFSKKYRHPECRWQVDHWDTRMRTVRQYEEKWEYVQNNPVRHGLVKRAEDWLYRAELHLLRWE
jgi:putative transposase